MIVDRFINPSRFEILMTWSSVLNSLSRMFLAWLFWVGICRARAMLCHEKLSSRATRAPWTPDSIRLFAKS